MVAHLPLTLRLHSVQTGKAAPFRGKEASAFNKAPVSGPIFVGRAGLAGDEQADRVHHGGPDKALHLYPWEHYAYWRDWLNGERRLDRPGAFGENLTSTGATEDQLCLGDRFAWGRAVIEISHGRQPCWKIDHAFGREGITRHVLDTGRCGVYFRVIEEGEARADDELRLIDRVLPDWSIWRMFDLLLRGGHRSDPDGLRDLAVQPLLAQAWRDIAGRLLAKGAV